MSRTKEYAFRLAMAALLRSAQWLQRRGNVETSYKVDSRGISVLFERCWFRYDLRSFGATGNIDFHGDGENATRHKLLALLKGDEVFYDIGAHGGVYSITLKKALPKLQLYSFEPQPDDLLANLALNGLSLDTVHAVALGDESGSVRMTSRNRSSNHVSSEGDIEVRMVRLDDYCDELGLPPPTWIKIDIEGLELAALKGAKSLICRGRPIIICEMNDLNARYGIAVSDLVEYVLALDYEIYRLDSGRLVPSAPASSLSELGFTADGNYWFVPSERHREVTA